MLTNKLYGFDNSDLISLGDKLIDEKTGEAFLKLQAAGKIAGFDIQIKSAFRSFEEQCTVWNKKATGKQTVYDKFEVPVDISNITKSNLVDYILIWSAIPGASRHHWGTDLDIYDANAIDIGDVLLLNTEYFGDGPCAPMHAWLVDNAYNYGFFFPYQKGFSSISPEPWHISYYPISSKLLTDFSAAKLKELLKAQPIELKDELLDKLDNLVQEYVFKIYQPI